jgi:hypothetical protein
VYSCTRAITRKALAVQYAIGVACAMRFVETLSQTFYMLYLYAKNEQGDLTAAQLKVLAKLVREEFT